MCIDYELNKKQIATLKGLDFITSSFADITNVDIFIQGKRIIAKYQPCSFPYHHKQFQNLVGVAECDNEDEFKEHIGIKLAISSLLKQTVDLAKDILSRRFNEFNKRTMKTLVSIKESQTKLKNILTRYSK